MSFISTLKEMFGFESGRSVDDEYSGIQLDTDRDGSALFKEDIIANIFSELEKRRNEKIPLEQRWILNANFLVGNQYCDIDESGGELRQIPPTYDWEEREVYNQIAPLYETRIANLKKITYAMTVKPRTNELDDYAKAEISSAVLRHKQKTSDFETKKNTFIHWLELCGTAFWSSWWDCTKGAEYAREGINLTDAEGNVTTAEKSYKEGDVDFGLLTPYEVFPESIFKQGMDAQRSIIVEQVKTVEDVYDLYGIDVEGGSVNTFQLTPVRSGGGFGYENTVVTIGTRTVDDAVKVVTYYEKPSRRYPDGKMAIIVGDTHLVYYGALPYKRIPIVMGISREVAGQFFGKSPIEDLIPRQRSFNAVMNSIQEFIRRTAIQSHFVEEGSIDIDMYSEIGIAPGSVVPYKTGYNPPKVAENGNLPAEIEAERYNIIRDMEYIAGVSQLTTSGSTPSGVTSGKAIEEIKATDDTRLSLTGDYIRNAVKDLGRLWLEIYKEYATKLRIIQCSGLNSIGNVLTWCNEDITSFDIEFTVENELLLSEEAREQKFINAYNMGFYTDENGTIPQRVKQKGLEAMKLNNLGDMLSINTLQLQSAQRENAFLEEGIIPEIAEFDDHAIHYEEHMRYVLQMQFKLLKHKKPHAAEMFEQHIKLHQQAMREAEAEKIQNAMKSQMLGEM